MEPLKVRLIYERSTKHTHVFSSDEPNAAVSTLYVAKRAFGGNAPSNVLEIQLTGIEEEVANGQAE